MKTIAEWTEEAACAGLDGDAWFAHPTDTATIALTRAVCRRCPVREQCLAEEMRQPPHSSFGMRGGLTADERLTLHRTTTPHHP